MSFDFFEQQEAAHPGDLADIMQKIEDQENLNFDFDQFDDPHPEPLDRSQDSDFFNLNPAKEEKPQSSKMQSAKSREPSRQLDLDNSRDLNEISIVGSNSSFRYEAPPARTPPLDSADQRYQNLQRLLNRAKDKGLDNFYRSLDQQNTYRQEDKFASKEEFKLYRNQLKAFKKTLEEDYQAKNGNYRFQNAHYAQPPQPPQPDQGDPFSDYNFKKKAASRPDPQLFGSKRSQDSDFFSLDKPTQPFNLDKPTQPTQPKQPAQSRGQSQAVNFLPTNDFQDDGLGDYELKPEDINREIQRYEQREYEKQAANFFSEDARKAKVRPERPERKLETINEQRANMFEVTQEEEKMSRLLSNYQELKSNFHSLMHNLKETNTDQEKIITELRHLKTGIENKESRLRLQEQNNRERQATREQQKQEKSRKITEIKEEIGKIKDSSDKDILILKLNEKVESLEEVLRHAIQELNQEKDPRLVPKIINYYNEPDHSRSHSHSRSHQNSRRSNRLAFDDDEEAPEPAAHSRVEQEVAGVRQAVRELREGEEEGELAGDFSSPLQLDLTGQDYPTGLSRGRSAQLEAPFVAAEGSREHQPTPLDANNKFLRRCLTQKSSVLFESFEFYITGKFTVTGSDRFPVTCEVRVANKCAISLYDVLVIVYGPQAQEAELQMRPARIMHDQFRHSTSFLFEVDLGRSCLESGAFSVQLSYKSDPAAKKKVNFRATLPFTHLIKPEFIYEEQFVNAWNQLDHELYVRPRQLDFKNIRSHEDLKLILPFTEINEPDPNCFSYGIMFSFPKMPALFMLKVTCYVSGKASLHLKTQGHSTADKRLREQTLDILSFLVFG